MGESGHCDVSDALVDALRRDGADRLDPVRFHFIEVLAHRASAHQGRVKRILDDTLAKAVAALRERLGQSPCEAQSRVAAPETPAHRETLGDLVRYLAQHSPEKMDSHRDAPLAPHAELKSVRYFRNTWSKLSAEKQVTQALNQAPKNAGPINSHVVVLRSLALMRDISPDYLNRFMSHVDTLLCLDLGDRGIRPPAKTPRMVKTARK